VVAVVSIGGMVSFLVVSIAAGAAASGATSAGSADFSPSVLHAMAIAETITKANIQFQVPLRLFRVCICRFYGLALKIVVIFKWSNQFQNACCHRVGFR
jgi:hypothetical protein